jgi:hypothetical protein
LDVGIGLNGDYFMSQSAEPSGKESYEIKQDRTATKATYDPTGAAVTNFGYTGGAACPPYTCNAGGYNSQIIGAWTFIDGLFEVV